MFKPFKFISLLIVSCVIIFGFGACDILDVSNPSNLTDKDLDNPESIDVLVNSAQGEALNAYPRAILFSGTISNELTISGTGSKVLRLDQGYMDITNNSRSYTADETYNALSVARWMGHFAETKIRKLTTVKNDIRLAKAEFFEAFSLIMLADNFKQVTLDGKAPISPKETYQLAQTKLKDALSIANTQTQKSGLKAPILGLLARVNYSLAVITKDNTYMDAAATYAQQALAADSHFDYEGVYNQTNQPNGVYSTLNASGVYIITSSKKYVGRKDPVTGKKDPRVNTGPFVQTSGIGVKVYAQQKYPSYNSSISIVKWQEMNLILAENALMNNNINQALGYLNKNRSEAGLPDMHTNDMNTARDYLIYERGSVLWLEGRRWFDQRHFNIPFAQWIPTNVNAGTDRTFPIPRTEHNSNDNI